MTAIHKDVFRHLIKHDAPIREAAKDFYARGNTIADEVPVDRKQARIDLLAIGKRLHGIELKSDGDTLHRLPRQATFYNRVFEQMTLVVGYSHLYDALTMIPSWWGVVTAEYDLNGRVVFERVRYCLRNPHVSKTAMLRLLDKSEMIALAHRANIPVKKSWGINRIEDVIAHQITQPSLAQETKTSLLLRHS